MNETRAGAMAWKNRLGRALAGVWLSAMRQPLWLCIRITWAILMGKRHDAKTTDKEA